MFFRDVSGILTIHSTDTCLKRLYLFLHTGSDSFVFVCAGVDECRSFVAAFNNIIVGAAACTSVLV